MYSVHENHRTHRTFPMARPKCLMRDFTNLNRIYEAHLTNVWWIMKVFRVHCSCNCFFFFFFFNFSGGKWTTYRHMAEETVDKAIEVCDLKAKNECVTKGLMLDGAINYTPTLFIRLVQDFGVDSEVSWCILFVLLFFFIKLMWYCGVKGFNSVWPGDII